MKGIIKYIPSKYKFMFKMLFIFGIYYPFNLIFNFNKTHERWILLTGFAFILVVLPIILWMIRVYKEETLRETTITDKVI